MAESDNRREWRNPQLRLEYLIDDSPEHREAACKHGLADRYIVVSAFGSREDSADPLLWVRVIEEVLLKEQR